MITVKLHEKIRYFVKVLERFAERIWYPPLIGLFAALDNFIVIIPNDGILISSAMLTPKRWVTLSLSVALGSTVGAVALASLVELYGLPWVLDIYPGLDQTKTWIMSMGFFEDYGLFLVFFVAVTPFVQQPAVILASLANTPLIELAAVIFIGRFIKFLIMAYLGSHAPKFLKRIWGLGGELQDVGLDKKI